MRLLHNDQTIASENGILGCFYSRYQRTLSVIAAFKRQRQVQGGAGRRYRRTLRFAGCSRTFLTFHPITACLL